MSLLRTKSFHPIITMSVVLGFIFPDFSVLMSDSRVTLRKGSGKLHFRDELQKLFQVSDHLAVGFASDDVAVSYSIIQGVTRFCRDSARSKNTLYLLLHLPRVIKFLYKKNVSSIRRPPAMSFVFVGSILGRGARIPTKDFSELLKKMENSFTLSPIMMQALFGGNRDGYMHFPAPGSALFRIDLPKGETYFQHAIGATAVGSGAPVFDDIEKEIHKIFLSPEKNMRLAMLQFSVRDFQQKAKIESVGGMSQILVIDGAGVYPHSHSFSQLDQSGKEVAGQKMVFENGSWYQLDNASGRKVVVSSNLLLINNDGDNKFNALAGLGDF